MLVIEQPPVSASKGKVFLAVTAKHGLKGWSTYWQSLTGFLHGYVSKVDLEHSIFSLLGEDKGAFNCHFV